MQKQLESLRGCLWTSSAVYVEAAQSYGFHVGVAHLQVQKQLDSLQDACNELQGSDGFMTLLKAVLALGNHLNQGTHKGNATGVCTVQNRGGYRSMFARQAQLVWTLHGCCPRCVLVLPRSVNAVPPEL